MRVYMIYDTFINVYTGIYVLSSIYISRVYIIRVYMRPACICALEPTRGCGEDGWTARSSVDGQANASEPVQALRVPVVPWG